MGFAKTVNKDMKMIGRKSSAVMHTIGQKAPSILSTVSKDLMIGAKAGEVVASVATLAGQPEIGAVVLTGAESLRLGSMAAGGASKSISQLNDKNYIGAVSTGVKTGTNIQKTNKKNIEKQQKREIKLQK